MSEALDRAKTEITARYMAAVAAGVLAATTPARQGEWVGKNWTKFVPQAKRLLEVLASDTYRPNRPMSYPKSKQWKRTGATRFVLAWFGRGCILQVQEARYTGYIKDLVKYRWRRATWQEALDLDSKLLFSTIDMTEA